MYTVCVLFLFLKIPVIKVLKVWRSKFKNTNIQIAIFSRNYAANSLSQMNTESRLTSMVRSIPNFIFWKSKALCVNDLVSLYQTYFIVHKILHMKIILLQQDLVTM